MDKYESLKRITDWIKNSSSEEFMEKFNQLDGNYSGMSVGDFLDSTETKEETEDTPVREEDA